MDPDPFAAVLERAIDLEAVGFSGVLRATRADEVLHESCHGAANRADRIPIRPSTRFATASLSKAFTAVGILEAAARGEVGLHDAVVDVLPPDLRPSSLRDDVTVHHLLTHTSGIADYFEEDETLPGHIEDMAEIWQTLPNYTVRDYVALLPLFADLPPNFPPGEYHYNNAGYVLLGIMLAEVSGMPFADAITTRVFEPVGMTASGYPAFDEVYPDIATGYLPPLAPGMPWRTNIYSVHPVGGGDGGAVVSAPDVTRFLRAVGRGGVWPGVTPADLLTPRAPSGDGWAVTYGANLRQDGVLSRGGGDPGVAALARLRASDDTTMVFLANIGWDDVEGLDGLLEAFDEAVFAA